MRNALDLHKAGNYAAAVPLLYAQIDGIVGDALETPGISLFSGTKKADLIDDTSIAGLPEGLQAMFSICVRNIKSTQQEGSISRHGILHGRELDYDTKMNSTKLFVFLLAVVEWAEPKIQQIAGQKQAEHESEHAGSLEVDKHGKLIDRRGFDETKSGLKWLHTCHSGWWRRESRYQENLLARIGTAGNTKGVSTEDGYHEHVSSDGQSWFAWRRTVTGRVFAIGACDSPPNEWLYDGPEPPSAPPGEDPLWGDAPFKSDSAQNW